MSTYGISSCIGQYGLPIYTMECLGRFYQIININVEIIIKLDKIHWWFGFYLVDDHASPLWAIFFGIFHLLTHQAVYYFSRFSLSWWRIIICRIRNVTIRKTNLQSAGYLSFKIIEETIKNWGLLALWPSPLFNVSSISLMPFVSRNDAFNTYNDLACTSFYGRKFHRLTTINTKIVHLTSKCYTPYPEIVPPWFQTPQLDETYFLHSNYQAWSKCCTFSLF